LALLVTLSIGDKGVGVQQLVLDIHLILKVCDTYVSDVVAHAANGICEKALRNYFARGATQLGQLQSGEWYNTKVAEAIGALGHVYKHFGSPEKI
jgi:hypothetical protein